nr:MAG TPA_asm: hypothetical protein [Caudoviricetes sp.]
MTHARSACCCRPRLFLRSGAGAGDSAARRNCTGRG